MNPYQPTYIKARTERDLLSQEFVLTAEKRISTMEWKRKPMEIGNGNHTSLGQKPNITPLGSKPKRKTISKIRFHSHEFKLKSSYTLKINMLWEQFIKV